MTREEFTAEAEALIEDALARPGGQYWVEPGWEIEPSERRVYTSAEKLMVAYEVPKDDGVRTLTLPQELMLDPYVTTVRKRSIQAGVTMCRTSPVRMYPLTTRLRNEWQSLVSSLGHSNSEAKAAEERYSEACRSIAPISEAEVAFS